MLLLISKLARKNNLKLPGKCYALDYLPDSLNCICDCDIICKFPPKKPRKEILFNKFHPTKNFELNYLKRVEK